LTFGLECANILSWHDFSFREGIGMADSGGGSYADFLRRKTQYNTGAGFDPIWIPDYLFDFQKCLTEWNIRMGRSATFADCGMGKGPMALVWAETVVRHTNRPVILITTLGDSQQMVAEAEKFQVEAVRSKDGKFPAGARVVVTNYERLIHFDPDHFAGVVCNESSILKNFKGKTKAIVTHFMRGMPYRSLWTATAAPNDYDELGTSAEAIGELGYQDMITKFFKKKFVSDYRGWSREKFQLKGHAERDFWRWVCSWARAVRKPSDCGPFDDSRFKLPGLEMHEHVVIARTKRDGYLFDLPATGLDEEREERRRTIGERCETVAGLVSDTGQPAVVWCHLNDEGDLLEKLIPGAVQVSGSDDDERKEEIFEAFATGQIRVLVTKPVIAGFGLNWQHCAHETFFPSHSFEQYYQALHRCLRYGQTKVVRVDMIASEGEAGVLANLQRKSEQADLMFQHLVDLVSESLKIDRTNPFDRVAELPKWMTPNGGISSADTTVANGSPRPRRVRARGAAGS
jgi:hypothetical protein